jgi:hypothetical protein
VRRRGKGPAAGRGAGAECVHGPLHRERLLNTGLRAAGMGQREPAGAHVERHPGDEGRHDDQGRALALPRLEPSPGEVGGGRRAADRLAERGQSGPLNEHFADVFGVLVRQWRGRESADKAKLTAQIAGDRFDAATKKAVRAAWKKVGL